MSTINTKITLTTIMPSGLIVTSDVIRGLDSNMPIAANYKLYELANNLAKESVKAIWNDDVALHTEMMQMLRDDLNMSCNVNSWYRTESYNKSVGGASNSLHLLGLATDLRFKKLQDTLFNSIRGIWYRINIIHGTVGGINRYTNGVHVSSKEDLFGYDSFVIRDYRGTSKDW